MPCGSGAACSLHGSGNALRFTCARLRKGTLTDRPTTDRRLLDGRGLHRSLGCRSVSSLPLHDHRRWGLVCLGLPPAVLVRWRLALRPKRAHSDCRADSHGAPIPRAHGRGGPPFPSCSSPARYARARQGAGGLRESGSRLRRAFLSAAANEPCSRLSLLLRVRFGFSRPLRPRGCRPSGAADVLARWLPPCPPTSVLGLPLEPLTLTVRRSRPPHDRLLT